MINRVSRIEDATGSLRAMMGTGLSPAELRALAPLPENAQKLIDNVPVKIGLERLAVVKTLLNEGLVTPLPNAMSVMEYQWEQISQAGGAMRIMMPGARGQNGTPDRRVKRVPIYITWDEFSINRRTLEVSNRVGQPLDTTNIEERVRRVNEAIEDAAINGSVLTEDGYSATGLLNAPNLSNKQRSADWATATGDQIVSDIQLAGGVLQGQKKFGPYVLFVGTVINNHLDSDFKANGDKTIRQRISELAFGGGPLSVVVADQLPTGTAVLVQTTSDVIDVINGFSPVVVPWVSPDGWTLNWVVMAIVVPRTRDDYDGNSGICTITSAADA